jgi:arylsulfatase A-like enzyme
MSRLLVLTAQLLVPLAAVCGADGTKPNIVLIVTDDQRPDTIHALGNTIIETPHLDHLVSRGMAFTRAYAGYPICHVSRAQILTGCHAFKALSQYPTGAIDPALATLAATFQSAGYHTCYSGKWHNDGHPAQRGYSIVSGLFASGGAPGIRQPATDSRGRPLTGYRGWTFRNAANEPELERGVGLQPDNSRHIAEGAIQAINTAPPGKPFLVHVNFAFPHDPRQWPAGMKDHYVPTRMALPLNLAPQHLFDHGNLAGRDELLLPKPLTESAVREELALYYAMISDVDAQIGRILTALSAAGHGDNTILIFTSDQGLALGSHGLLGKQNQYEHTIRSPFIIAGPGLPKNRRSAALVNLNDIFPTLCELAGIAIPPTVEARSLVPLLRGQTDRIHDFVAGCFTDTQRMIRDTRWKLICYPQIQREQLFDLDSDPHEQIDLSTSAAQRSIRDDLKHRLNEWCRQHQDPYHAGE